MVDYHTSARGIMGLGHPEGLLGRQRAVDRQDNVSCFGTSFLSVLRVCIWDFGTHVNQSTDPDTRTRHRLKRNVRESNLELEGCRRR